MSELEFTGACVDTTGKVHTVRRTKCSKCSDVVSETHFGCCNKGSFKIVHFCIADDKESDKFYE